ncbi:MAG: hypothetical protein GY810_12130 [Aureispira sp.]|nr:hypothetical protein [Aureispira sp.]
MAKIIKPPELIPKNTTKPILFLAGTIDMGKSEDWQSFIGNKLSDLDIIILNPRRDDWDSSWKQEIDNKQFRDQVDWELDGLDCADYIFFHFEPDSKSPITLLELGLYANSKKCLVHCPNGFWRKGNIDVVCARYNIPQVDTLQNALELLKSNLKS